MALCAPNIPGQGRDQRPLLILLILLDDFSVERANCQTTAKPVVSSVLVILNASSGSIELSHDRSLPNEGMLCLETGVESYRYGFSQSGMNSDLR